MACQQHLLGSGERLLATSQYGRWHHGKNLSKGRSRGGTGSKRYSGPVSLHLLQRILIETDGSLKNFINPVQGQSL
jgi:hypothetical protein